MRLCLHVHRAFVRYAQGHPEAETEDQGCFGQRPCQLPWRTQLVIQVCTVMVICRLHKFPLPCSERHQEQGVHGRDRCQEDQHRKTESNCEFMDETEVEAHIKWATGEQIPQESRRRGVRPCPTLDFEVSQKVNLVALAGPSPTPPTRPLRAIVTAGPSLSTMRLSICD